MSMDAPRTEALAASVFVAKPVFLAFPVLRISVTHAGH
jgi:hypothetical protein